MITKKQLQEDNEKLRRKLQQIQDSLQIYECSHATVRNHPYANGPHFIEWGNLTSARDIAKALLRDGMFSTSSKLSDATQTNVTTLRITVQKP
jgi:hypothetical protein